ncbi:hypothetical protein P7K49_015301, partial [Saguinus oedipus]
SAGTVYLQLQGQAADTQRARPGPTLPPQTQQQTGTRTPSCQAPEPLAPSQLAAVLSWGTDSSQTSGPLLHRWRGCCLASM